MRLGQRILLIIPSLGVGGAERALCALSVALEKRGHQVWLLHFDGEVASPFKHGGTLLHLNVRTGKSFIRKLVAFIKRVRRVGRLKSHLQIDASISFLEGADFVNVLSRRKDKVIVSIRSSKIHYESATGPFRLIRSKILIPTLYRCADHVVALQHNVAAELNAHYKIAQRKLHVIQNFYDALELRRLAAEPVDIEAKGRKVLVASGRLHPIKGFEQFLDVMAGLKRRAASYQLWLLGDGPLRTVLEQKAQTLGLTVGDSRQTDVDVIFLGNQPNPWKYMSKADAFVLSSVSESFGNALAEALIIGLPAVCADCPYGPRELMLGEKEWTQPIEAPTQTPYGMLMPMLSASTIKVWIDTINDFLTDPHAPDHPNKVDCLVDRYSADVVVAKWESLFA